jgi:plastocyanin
MRRHAIIGVLALPVLALALAACGGNSSGSAAGTTTTPSTTTPSTTPAPSGSGTATTLELEADPTGALDFNKTTLEAPAGKVTIEMTNPSSVPHDIAIEGNGVDVVGDVVTDGGTSTVSTNLEPGTYTFYCTVDSHESAGMKGTLTVR